MTPAPTVLLPGRVLGPSLTVAGLAGWILAYAGLDTDARRTRDLQDLVDAGLRCGEHDVEIVRTVVEEAVALWQRAATLADEWAEEARETGAVDAGEFTKMAARLRLRADALTRLMGPA